MAPPAVDDDAVVPVANGVEDGLLRIQLFALLVVIGDLHVGAAPHLPRVGRQLAEDDPQQRRFAGAVRADEADAVAAHDAR